jgi:hypothetical protein
MDESISLDYNDGLDRLMRWELSRAIFQAMTRLKLGWRNVPAFQCFEQMSYAEIADLMACKELRVYGELAALNAVNSFPVSRLSIPRPVLEVVVGARHISYL